MKKIDYQKQGIKNRLSGARFELKVRSDLESKGWIVDRWTNNVEFPEGISKQLIEARNYGKLIKAKSFMGRSRTNGFPDFIAFKSLHMGFIVQGVECKSNGYLDKIEKEKCVWYLKNNIFSKILIASKGTKRGEIKYVEFK